MGDIKARSADVFPKELEDRIAEPDDGFSLLNARIKQGFFFQQYSRIIDRNFAHYSQAYERRAELEAIVAQDIAANYHLYPQFLSRVASPDANNYDPVDQEDDFLQRLERNDLYGKRGQMKRGIRTLREVAHFVRSIPIKKYFQKDNVWSTPDVMVTMRCG